MKQPAASCRVGAIIEISGKSQPSAIAPSRGLPASLPPARLHTIQEAGIHAPNPSRRQSELQGTPLPNPLSWPDFHSVNTNG